MLTGNAILYAFRRMEQLASRALAGELDQLAALRKPTTR